MENTNCINTRPPTQNEAKINEGSSYKQTCMHAVIKTLATSYLPAVPYSLLASPHLLLFFFLPRPSHHLLLILWLVEAAAAEAGLQVSMAASRMEVVARFQAAADAGLQATTTLFQAVVDA